MSRQNELPVAPFQILLARALYDNQAEFPNELSFKRMDVVTVLKRDPKGYAGWWICCLNGRIGMVPGNRFELLGQVERKNRKELGDEYDDPMEWFTKKELMSISSERSNTESKNESSVESCLDNDSVLTDSGNYSNRSSDISLEPQSTYGRPDCKPNNRLSDSPSNDYEDLDDHVCPALDDPNEEQSCYKKSQTILISAFPDTEDPYGVSELIHPVVCEPPNKRFPDNSSKNDHEPDVSLSTPIDRTPFLNQLPETTNPKQHCEFLSKAMFMEIILPTKTSLEAMRSQLNTMFPPNTVVSGSKPVSQHSWNDLKSTCATDLNTLIDVSQRMVELTLTVSDSGLLRRFVCLRKTFRHTTPRINRLMEELSPPDWKHSSRQNQLANKLITCLDIILESINVLETTSLANASLLFCEAGKHVSNAVIRRSPRPTILKSDCSTPNQATICPSARSTNSPETRGCAQFSESVTQPLNFITEDSVIESLKGRCANCLKIVQEFLYLIYPKKLDNKLEGLPKYDASMLTTYVKDTMVQCTELIRLIAVARENLSRLDSSHGSLPVADLQNKGGALCETLKGLLIQTKEAASYLSDCDLEQQSSKPPVVPGPLLQRLVGAANSVRVILQTMNDRITHFDLDGSESV